jgi:exonuclease III
MGAVRIAPMAKAFSVASWNIEHMKDADPRNAARMQFLAGHKPDVLALYEVEGKDVWREVMAAFPKYSFFITEGQNTQEILLGVGPRVTGFLTQKVEFAGRQAYMRPGAFLTVRAGGTDYSLLFLHVASDNDPRGFGLRADMIDRAFTFRAVLDKAAGGPANYMFLGDLNLMGMDFEHGKEAGRIQRVQVTAQLEVTRLAYAAAAANMRVLPKTRTATWRDLDQTSDLDWVVAANHLRFRCFAGAGAVDGRGWPALPEAEQVPWTKDFSDHGLLYFEVQTLP